MKTSQIILLLLTVMGISSGQLLFKQGALGLDKISKPWEYLLNAHIFIGMVIYGICTVMWIYLLREVSLSKAYPLFALSFVIVPILSWLFFNESLDKTYFAGLLLIVGGVILTTR